MTTRPPTPEDDARAHNAEGQFVQTLESADVAADAARLRARGLSYAEIARAQGCSKSSAVDRVKRALAAVPAEAVHELRAVSDERLNMLIARAMSYVIERHPMVSHGRIIPDVFDPRVNLMAIREVRMLDAELRAVYGVNAPARLNVTVSDAVIEEIERLALALNVEAEAVTVNDRYGILP